MLSWKFGKNVRKLGTRTLGSGVFLLSPAIPSDALLRVHVPGSAI